MTSSLRRDALPVWVSVLLLLFLVLRVVEVTTLPHGAASKQTPDVSDAAMQDLIETDQAAKTAYALSLRTPGPVVRLDEKTLRQALAAAETLEQDTGNSPAAARRVIILRALVRNADTPAAAKKDRAPLAVGKNRINPLSAFTTALPAKMPPLDRAADAAEGQVWKTAFSGASLTPDQTSALAAQIRRLPNIRWWLWPALSGMYGRQGDLAEANRYALAARAHALSPLAATGFLMLLHFLLGLAGVLILIYFVVKAIANAQRTANTPPFPNLWPTVPEQLPFSERKLGAGDLMAVFVVYLLAREVIELALEGFPGFGHHHVLQVPGLLTPFLGTIKQMPALQRGTLEIVLSAVTYILAAVPPLVYLWVMARQRGASLGQEIGWTKRALLPNLAYGVAGYAISIPLMLLVALLAPALFRHAPAPSNPVIPEMMFTSGFWTTMLLIVLASVAAPFVEELLFRGVFYNSIKLLRGPWTAIVTTGLVFGFVHPVGIVEMLAIAVLGGVFAWMAETRKSLAPSMTAHCLNNLTVTLLLLFALAR